MITFKILPKYYNQLHHQPFTQWQYTIVTLHSELQLISSARSASLSCPAEIRAPPTLTRASATQGPGWVSLRPAPRTWRPRWTASLPAGRPATSSWWRPSWGSRSWAWRSSWCEWLGPSPRWSPGRSAALAPPWPALCPDGWRINTES